MSNYSSNPFDLDVRVSKPGDGDIASPASWTPARSRTIKCTKATCRCTDTCASCSPNGIFC
ncbi:FDLD family class I lanthipeptide [Arthrobacter sp. LS16]|uniref:FDLD family class I lanthipeptide n=1 Tax=Arthrobacter sp. 'calajunan' TaxID=1690248 RepID=UPI003C74F94C